MKKLTKVEDHPEVRDLVARIEAARGAAKEAKAEYEEAARVAAAARATAVDTEALADLGDASATDAQKARKAADAADAAERESRNAFERKARAVAILEERLAAARAKAESQLKEQADAAIVAGVRKLAAALAPVQEASEELKNLQHQTHALGLKYPPLWLAEGTHIIAAGPGVEHHEDIIDRWRKTVRGYGYSL